MRSEATEPTLPESVVRPLCQPFKKAADSVLDLYGMTQTASSPGQCVQCFFKLLHVSDAHSQAALEPLKCWMEEHIEVSIRAGDAHSGSFPLYLDAPDLDQLCESVLERVCLDTMTHTRPIELSFEFRNHVA
ncbi:hypothetical protein [Cerasicoccus maritimus]|uniref:hypothetical protein n=1 Tax=Cerasicoccus maritimus TaxID=490089 RepID=UPI002852BDFE|nr:hypothetical protein [Cerasicoccus maritimus]